MPFIPPNHELVCKRYNDPWWIVERDLWYDAGRFGIIKVPAGTVTDFCSYPGKAGEPAGVVHDFLYQTGQLSKDAADRIFYTILREDGISPVKAAFMYQAVKYFGWKTWKKYRAEDTK